MTLPEWSRPGESRARSLALVLAVALPLVLHAAAGWQASGAALIVWLTLPVLLAAWLGGLPAGVLATVVALAVPAVRLAGGAPIDLAPWLALAATGAFASVAFDCWIRTHRSVVDKQVDLARQSQFHAAAADLAAEFAWSGRFDADKLVIDSVTPGFERTVGVTVDELNRRGGIVELVHPDDSSAFSAALRSVATGQSASGELRWHIGGRALRCHYELRPLLDDEGAVVGLCGALRDVTETHALVQQLREWKDRYEATVMATGLVLFDYDSASDQVVFGGDVQGLLGHWPSDLNGALADWLRRLHPDDVNRFAAEHQAALAEQRAFRLDYRVRHHDGRWVVVEQSGRAVDGEAPTARHVVGFLRDVTAQRRTQDELRERQSEQQDAAVRIAKLNDELNRSNLRKDEFLATLAHELRNPLAPIRNASMLLGLQDGSPQGIDWIRRVIERQTDHMARLIDDLLDVSRIAGSKLTLRLERVALDRVIDAAVESVRSQIDAQRHQLTVEVPSGLWLQGDQIRLTQIFTNLLANAVKYTSPGGAIRIQAAREDAAVRVSVRDNGIGIPPDQLPQLFEMFYQVDRSIERAHAGLGIGLTLAERLVRMHGGDLRALSDGLGRGAEFQVRLPLADKPAKPEAPAGSISRAVRGLRILVADDSVDSALTLTALLAAAGHEVEAVHDGFAALHRAAEFRPHVLVLDIGMPGLNGYDTCRRIRAEPWGRHSVIIAVTGWGTEEDRRRSREAGFDAHLVKPVDYSELQKHFALDNIPS
jgi:PAS domain S-box-containing protein